MTDYFTIMTRKRKYIPLNRNDPRQWQCPHCFAAIGERCQTIGGKENLSFHEARRKLVKVNSSASFNGKANSFSCAAG